MAQDPWAEWRDFGGAQSSQQQGDTAMSWSQPTTGRGQVDGAMGASSATAASSSGAVGSYKKEQQRLILQDTSIPEWMRMQNVRLGGFGTAEETNPAQLRKDREVTKETWLVWSYRDNVEKAPVLENPHQYVNVINGRPTVFMVVTFEQPTDEEIQFYWASKFAPLKVMLLFSRWAKAPHEPADTKPEGSFWDCMKHMVVDIGTAACWPRDMLLKYNP